MNHAVGSPLPDLVDGGAEVFEQVAIGHFDVTCPGQQCDKPGDAVDN